MGLGRGPCRPPPLLARQIHFYQALAAAEGPLTPYVPQFFSTDEI